LPLFGDGEFEPEEDGRTTLDERRTARGGNSSPDAPEESLKNFCLRIVSFWGGGIETAVETVGFGGTSPVGVCSRGFELLGVLGLSNLEPSLELVGELETD
jgi:hypothetical protein